MNTLTDITRPRRVITMDRLNKMPSLRQIKRIGRFSLYLVGILLVVITAFAAFAAVCWGIGISVNWMIGCQDCDAKYSLLTGITIGSRLLGVGMLISLIWEYSK